MREFDYSSASAYLARVFGGGLTEHAVELRAISSEGGRPAALFTRDPQDVELFCQRWDGPGRAIYYSQCTRISGRATGRRQDLAEIGSLWADIDCVKLGLAKDEVVAALRNMHLPPSVIIDSGYGIHAHWHFTEALDISVERAGAVALEAELVAALRCLAGIVCGDIAVCDLARVMRVPGTHNTKGGALVLCTVIEATWARYEWRDLQEMLDWHRPVVVAPTANDASPPTAAPDNPFAEFAKRFAFKAPIDCRKRLEAMTYLGLGEAGIHQTQLQVSASLVGQGLEDDEIVALVLDATARAAGLAGEQWNWSREEANLRRMIADWRKKQGVVTRPRSTGAAVPPTGATATAPVVQLRPHQQEGPQPEPQPELAGYPLDDLGNAMRLIAQHGAAIRYVRGIDWHVWDGTRYKSDPDSLDCRKLAHEVVRTMLLQAFDLPAGTDPQKKARREIIKFAVASGNAGRTSAMLEQAEPHLKVEPDDLDADPWLLNCPNGTVDLRTGELRPHRRDDLLTKLAGTAYETSATCPIWENFLFEIFDGDSDVVAFVQRAFGYSMTGMTTEQAVFILHGAGSNGKSVLIETVSAVLADYKKTTPSETWVTKPHNGPSNDIASLVGARFVPVIETEHDKQLAEALVKQATGGDTMTARFHYKEFFSFIPRFKLWLATNHKPRIRGSEYAIWRRILLLPFLVTFVDKDKVVEGQKVKDPELKNKLIAEHPGILAWMVRGCMDWQKVGLQPPAAVLHATEDYQDSQDNVSAFIRDNCHLSRGLSCGVGILHTSYVLWCEANDEDAIDKRRFGKNLDERGYPSGPRTMRQRIRQGIDLTLECREAALQRMADMEG